MNRRRASEKGVPSKEMATYFKQRASSGLMITDNTLIASNGGQYRNTPAIFNDRQQRAWKNITEEVHAKGGKIFMQLVHGGRVGHSSIQDGKPLIAPSALQVNETIRVTDDTYEQMTLPVAIGTEEIGIWVDAYKEAAIRAMKAGFDGVEIHAAHGFLIDQFINPSSNQRTDGYGGSISGRTRFLFEVLREVISAIGKDKIGVRLSPFREIYGLKPYPDERETHQFILDELQKMDILYIHFSREMLNGTSSIPLEFLRDARGRFKNLIMIAGGFTIESAEMLLESGLVDLIAFGRLFISNPDLVARIEKDAPLAKWDEATFYHGGAKGYIDY